MKIKKFRKRIGAIEETKRNNLSLLLTAGLFLYSGTEAFVHILPYVYYYDSFLFWLIFVLSIITLTCYLMGMFYSLTNTFKIDGKKQQKDTLKDHESKCNKSLRYTKSFMVFFIIQSIFLLKLKWDISIIIELPF